jgi:hypothetical protein
MRNENWRKIRKLVCGPKLFFADWARKNVPGVNEVLISRAKRNPHAYYASGIIKSSQFSFESMVQGISSEIPLLLTIDPRQYHLGVLEGHLLTLIGLLRDIAKHHALEIDIELLKQKHKISNFMSEALMMDLRRACWFRVNFFKMDKNQLPILSADFYIYRSQDDVYVNSARKIELRHLPRKSVVELLGGETGVWFTSDVLSGSRNAAQDFPVDFVYTWVNCEDSRWKALYESHFGTKPEQDRFLSRDELRYSLRSVHYYAGWVNKIYIVSNCSPPPWLNLESGSVVWVDHEEILEAKNLPTFNSHAIEATLWKIPGLSNRFVYFNDDFFLLRPVHKGLFFDRYGRSSAFLEPIGTIAPERSDDEESWYLARVKAQLLLLERKKFAATRMHHHAPYAINRDDYAEMLREFNAEIHAVEGSRTRNPEDIPTVSYMYPHYVLDCGRGNEVDVGCQMLNLKNYEMFSPRPSATFLCINDGGGSAGDVDFDRLVREFLANRFPITAPWEK